MKYILKFSLPNLYTIIIVTIIKKGFLNKTERVKGFCIFMTMSSLKPAESNHSKKEPCKQGCTWIIKLSHWMNFGYGKHGVIFSIQTPNGCIHCMHTQKSVMWTTSDTF